MERDVPAIPGPVSPPDPPQDRPGSTVTEFAVLVHAVGPARLRPPSPRQLPALRRRPTFPIAACFGGANLSIIFAGLNRGILRTAALERALLARAAIRRHINIVSSHTSAFWNELFEFMHFCAGSVATVMRGKSHRQQAFVREQHEVREANARMLAFFDNAHLALLRGHLPGYRRL
jgi:hypothetical protein